MRLGHYYVRKGVLYLQRLYLRIEDEFYAVHDDLAIYWKVWEISQKIESGEKLTCEHCAENLSVREPKEAQYWIGYGVCDDCYGKGELYVNDEVCIHEKLFLRKGGKVPKDEVSEEELYNTTLN